MKNLSLILLVLAQFSCSAKEETANTNILENLRITMDTVSVDVGEELFDPASYKKRTLSRDGTRIFFESEGSKPEIHEINLKDMRLIQRHGLAEDGPDRVPRFGTAFQWLPNDRFFLFSQGIAGIYGLDGKKEQSISTRLAELPELETLEGIGYFPKVWLSPDGTKLMAIPYKHDGWFLRLVVVDLPAKTGKILELPALEMTKGYQVRWEENGVQYQGGDFVSGFLMNDQLILGSSSTADFYCFDWKTDSLLLVENEARSLPKTKTGSIPNNLGSEAEWREVSKRLGKMVNYRELLFDPSRQQYFRLATQNAAHDVNGNKRSDEVWLLVYDSDLRLIGERQIEGIVGFPIDPFFSGGKLYGSVLWEEVPGFTVMTLDF
ncbi:DUF4221 family protein [Algoriphagus sp. H41]|uniref:DUF4221 family protein n=1 Tax=Algoriphagus oliviformis TaxID=2811231 RepID=A0ABS3BY89_9BACT|nr:DUF4221 family protein [Algoriphagus oliviformis]MBN7809832.1 DUF4221 family protein [Algoriphagus oliviformis]